MNTIEFLKWSEDFALIGKDKVLIRPICVCNDGFYLSIQHSDLHECESVDDTPATVEIAICCRQKGWNKRKQKLKVKEHKHKDELSKYKIYITHYAEDDHVFLQYHYGNVPIDVVDKLIKTHGGVNKNLTLELI